MPSLALFCSIHCLPSLFHLLNSMLLIICFLVFSSHFIQSLQTMEVTKKMNISKLFWDLKQFKIQTFPLKSKAFMSLFISSHIWLRFISHLLNITKGLQIVPLLLIVVTVSFSSCKKHVEWLDGTFVFVMAGHWYMR